MDDMATTPSPFLKPASIERAEAAPAKQPEKDSPKNGPQKNRSRLRWILIAATVMILAALLAAGM